MAMNLFAKIGELGGRIKQLVSPSFPVTGGGGVLPETNAFIAMARIGGHLTPSVLSSLIIHADHGHIRRLVDLMNESRQKDGHLQSVLFTRESAISSLPWVIRPAIKPGRQEPLARDKRIAQFVEQALRQLEPGKNEHGFSDLLAHLNGAVVPGFSVAETNWQVKNGRTVPRAFKLIAHRRFEYSEDGQLLWDDTGMANGVDLQEWMPGKFIVHQPRINGDVPMREGLIRVLLWLALFRSWTLGDWVKLAELAWKPWRLGQYGQGTNKENKDTVIKILQSLSSTGVAAHSDNVKIDIKFPDGTSSANHAQLLEFLGSEMSKAVLGQTLTTESGARGARSLGEVHNEIRKDIRDADAIAVAETLARDLVNWIVRINFGDVPLPRFEFVTEDRRNLKDFGEGIERMVSAGVKIGQSWVRDEAGIPDPKDGEEICVPVDTSDLGSLQTRDGDDGPPPGTEPDDPPEPGDGGAENDVEDGEQLPEAA